MSGVDGLHIVVSAAMRHGRAAHGWRQKDLADRLQDVQPLGAKTWSANAVAATEAGRRRVDLNELAPLCQVFKITLAQLISGQPYLEYVPQGAEDILLAEVAEVLFGEATAKVAASEALTREIESMRDRLNELLGKAQA